MAAAPYFHCHTHQHTHNDQNANKGMWGPHFVHMQPPAVRRAIEDKTAPQEQELWL